jgi:hypothetical protein
VKNKPKKKKKKKTKTKNKQKQKYPQRDAISYDTQQGGIMNHKETSQATIKVL